MPALPNTLKVVAWRRRSALACVVLTFVILAAFPMARILARDGWSVLKAVFFALFLILFAQVVFAGAVATVGWWLLRQGRDPAGISGAGELGPGAALPATAIVMPIYNEDADRVFQGLRTMYQSLEQTGQGGAFDFFILSDTNDPNGWMAEEMAWFELCKQAQGFGRIFYRRRRVLRHHKSGNIADFCRRWGAAYRYMIVLDADSIMTGAALVRLAALMEQHPWAGIIQSVTRPILGQSCFQRLEQFAASVYRPLFAAGTCFWQLGDATFWGHNAIVRLKPFMEHCAMPELPEVGPLGTQILSHDTIEAALMRKEGWEVWQVYDLDGSYEEGPPHLLASLQRDRRWCHGNLQHLWFLFEHGVKFISRFNILTGILAYANSPLWLLSLALGVLLAMQHEGNAAPARPGASGDAAVAIGLYACVMGLLFAPKILGAMLLLESPETLKRRGSRAKAVMSVAAETIYSMLLAPILMLFYTRFVLASFCGLKVGWGPQTRADEQGPSWDSWFDVHGVNTIFALGAAAWVGWRTPALLPWLAPVLAGPILAIPLSRITASQRLGLSTKTRGWLVTDEEAKPPVELEKLAQPFLPPRQPFFCAPEYAADYGLLQAVLDPYVNAVHVSLLRQRTEGEARTRERLAILADQLLLDGPFVLSRAEKRTLLWDAETMLALHQKLWNSPPAHLHEWWQAAFRHYVESSALTIRRSVGLAPHMGA